VRTGRRGQAGPRSRATTLAATTLAATTLMLATLAGAAALLTGCGAGGLPPGDRTWLDQMDEAPDRVVARQLRGLDVAMIEIDHRYSELYFAAQDGNWDYAEHQVEHMALAMDLALERRPHRAPSARAMFYPALERVEAAVEARDDAAFTDAFERLRGACNACHVAEGEGAMVVGVPSRRRTNIRPPSPSP
jgi:hypothetical protein